MSNTALANTPPDSSPMTLLAGMDMGKADPDKIGQLLEIQAKWEDRQSEKQLAAAMADFQKSAPSITKERQSNNSKYASLDDIMFAIRESLGNNGLSVSFDTGIPSEGTLSVTCHVMHAGGAKFNRIVTVPVDKLMKVNDTQKMGSAISYAKRYAIIAALNLIVSDHADDDGLAGGTQTISAKEYSDLMDLLDSLEEREKALVATLEYAEVESLDQIPSEKLGSILKALKSKKRK